MESNKEVKISFWASHLTTIVSVTMVLLLIGVVASVWIGVTSETRRLRESVELTAVLADSVSNAEATHIGRDIERRSWSRRVKVITREQALESWTKATGEDLSELYGVNPLSPEVSFSIREPWSGAKEIMRIRAAVAAMPGVESVDAPDSEMIESMNSNIAGMTLILVLIASVMLVISFVLINNTVQLTIYSRRFSIHTMKLVGATGGFISRPIVGSNVMCGFLAGLLASGLLAAILASAPHLGISDLSSAIGWLDYAAVSGGMILLGVLLCALAAWIATARYLRKDYGELFR